MACRYCGRDKCETMGSPPITTVRCTDELSLTISETRLTAAGEACLAAARQKRLDEANMRAQLDAAREAVKKLPRYQHSKFCLYYDDEVCRCDAGRHNLAIDEARRALGLEG